MSTSCFTRPVERPVVIKLRYNDRALLLEKPATHAEALADARRRFRIDASAGIVLLATIDGESLEICDDAAWAVVEDWEQVRVEMEELPFLLPQRPFCFSSLSQWPSESGNGYVLPSPTGCTAPIAVQSRPAATYTISVKTLTGNTISLEVQSTTTVDQLKRMISDKEGIPGDQQRLVYSGRPIETGTLADHTVHGLSTVHLVLRCRWVRPDSKIPGSDVAVQA